MAFLDHIRACNGHDPSKYTSFLINGLQVGRVTHAFARALADWPEHFQQSESGVELHLPQQDLASRSAVFAELLCELEQQGVISHLHGEQYEATPNGRGEGIVYIDRAAAPYFGTRAFGQHLNGFVRDSSGLRMWIGRRSADRRIYPGYLDNLVAGGLPADITLQENLVKECWEEAGISRQQSLKSRSVGAITYYADHEKGFKPDTLYCYDLELPKDFKPRCTDGEVEAFYLLPVEEVMEIVRDSDQFKLNCNLVVIDFLLRHGYLTPDDPDYLAIVNELHPAMPLM